MAKNCMYLKQYAKMKDNKCNSSVSQYFNGQTSSLIEETLSWFPSIAKKDITSLLHFRNLLCRFLWNLFHSKDSTFGRIHIYPFKIYALFWFHLFPFFKIIELHYFNSIFIIRFKRFGFESVSGCNYTWEIFLW